MKQSLKIKLDFGQNIQLQGNGNSETQDAGYIILGWKKETAIYKFLIQVKCQQSHHKSPFELNTQVITIILNNTWKMLDPIHFSIQMIKNYGENKIHSIGDQTY